MNFPSQILVVEDNLPSRRLLEIALGKQGYSVVAAESATEAQEQLTPARIRSIACVVTDYQMPGLNGLELLAWIRERDPSLATILVTAQGERTLIADSLRGGAVDFLDKPVDLKKLNSAVASAVEQTRLRRRMAASETAVKELGRAQKRMLDAETSRSPGVLRVHYYPKHDAGGDYFTHFRPSAHELCCLLTDVSGHDLRAAYVSAYFQGFVRGQFNRGATMEEIFSDFNRFLLEELNDVGGVRSDVGAEMSVAVCAVLLDFTAQTATVTTRGTPSPVYLAADGNVQVIGENGGVPLGWFPTLDLQRTTCSIADGGSFYLWTDGFEDLAEREGVSTLSLACALQRSNRSNKKLPCLTAANDDILLAAIQLATENSVGKTCWPILSECYHGGQLAEIDKIQALWRRSLTLAAPELPESRLHDILLASREAVLNALKHGCGGSPACQASFQVAYDPAGPMIRVRVSDPGPGHQFDVVRHEQLAERELVDEHRGLIFVKRLATSMEIQRDGASISMNFAWQAPNVTDHPIRMTL